MGALDAAARLNASLDEVAAALAAPDAEALLAAEAGLVAALDGLRLPADAAPGERAALAAAVARARATLARCRILGTALADATRIALAAQGRAADYGPSGGPMPVPASGTRGRHVRARL